MKKILHNSLSPFSAIFLSCTLAVIFSGCDAIADEDTPSPSIDWQAVEATPEDEAALILSCLLRAVDYWHKGEVDRLDVSFDSKASKVTDEGNNEIDVSPEDWKGMVLFVHNLTQRSDYDGVHWRAQPYGEGWLDCGDDWGKIQRFAYKVRMKDKLRLDIKMIRPIYIEGVD